MSTATRAATGLMPAGWDPRPCVNKPPQWWDLGNKHNARAIRYCRNVCPRLAGCKADIASNDTPKPLAQIRAGIAYSDRGTRLTTCGDCERPRLREGSGGTVTCGTPNCGRAPEPAPKVRRLPRSSPRPPRGRAIVDAWAGVYRPGLTIRQTAEILGLRAGTLTNALSKARMRGDQRVPDLNALRWQLHKTSQQEQPA